MLQEAVDFLIYTVFSFSKDSLLGKSINFFIYDSIKILFLLFLMITFVGFLRTYISVTKVRKFIQKRKFGTGNLIASIFGAVTPFCSCSSIPIFISFTKSGIPMGVAFSFLITSPIINEYLAFLMFALFGWKIMVAYVISGILIGTIVGMVLGKMNLEKYLTEDFKVKAGKVKEQEYEDIFARVKFGVDEAVSIVKKIWIWILAGVALGAAIHNLVPQDLIQRISSFAGIFSVPIATAIGVPMYASCAAILPVAAALFQKGLPLGTVLAFMMSTSALSFPEAVILRRVMRLKLILIFFGIVALSIILTGYLFNFLQFLLI
jgi:uncharacterized membrane protein YraQ (UPF0718 family)